MSDSTPRPASVAPPRAGAGAVALDLLADAARGVASVRFEPSGREIEVAQIWRDAHDVARWLRARTGAGGRVGAFLTNTPDCPAVVIGTWLAGLDLVSLPYPGRGSDLTEFTAQIEVMCDLAGVQVLLVDDAYRAFLPPMPVPTAGFGEALTGGPASLPTFSSGTGAGAGAGGLVQFTSGSLGRPKGVVLTGQALAANILAIIDATDIQPGERAVSWLPLSHDMGFVGMFLSALSTAAPSFGGELLVLQTPESFLADPASWLRSCSRHRATITTAPNFAFDLSVRAAKLLGEIDLSSLRVCITGAERVRADTLRRFTETFAPAGLAPEVICPAYGMAEAALAVTMKRPDEVWRTAVRPTDPGSDPRSDPGPAVSDVGNGAPLRGMQVRIVDAGAGERAPGVGDVQIRGESLFSDYLGATRTLTDDGWFPTRDVGYLDGGELFLVGRADESIIVGGRNFYATDIEHAVRHDAVRAGCLAALPTDDGFVLIAEPASGLGPDRLAAVCRELAVTTSRRVGARPALVAFVPRGQLMKTPSGKLRRMSMAAALQSGDLELIASSGTR